MPGSRGIQSFRVVNPLRLSTSADLKRRRLAALREQVSIGEAQLLEIVRDAQTLGSLELAGFALRWEDVRSRNGTAPIEVARMRVAQSAVASDAAIGLASLLSWHAALLGSDGLRRSERVRSRTEDLPPAPPDRIEGRLRILEDWLSAQSSAELAAAQRGALVLARVVEILPFEDGNGRVARLATSHAMERAGALPPILAGGDKPRLEAALSAAFRLDTEPLAALLQEASERALDVMIQSLERGERG